MEERSDEADESEQAAVLGGGVVEEGICEEGEGEFHAGEGEEEDEVDEVEEGEGVSVF